jgi:hypothetical protein
LGLDLVGALFISIEPSWHSQLRLRENRVLVVLLVLSPYMFGKDESDVVVLLVGAKALNLLDDASKG